jgi:Domain of unknown function (DUF1877)
MACLGVHFALTDADVATLLDLENDDARLAYVREVLEERELGGPGAAESDKAWDAMHRVLSDGQLTLEGGEYPLNHVVLGGQSLYDGEDFLMTLKSAAEVRDIAQALSELSEHEFRARYQSLGPDYDGEMGEEDLSYTWEWFQGVRALYLQAAEAGKSVLFTADQ